MCDSVGRMLMTEGHCKTVSSLKIKKKKYDSACGGLKKVHLDQNHLPTLLLHKCVCGQNLYFFFP